MDKELVRQEAKRYATIPRNLNINEQPIYQAGIEHGFISGFEYATANMKEGWVMAIIENGWNYDVDSGYWVKDKTLFTTEELYYHLNPSPPTTDKK